MKQRTKGYIELNKFEVQGLKGPDTFLVSSNTNKVNYKLREK